MPKMPKYAHKDLGGFSICSLLGFDKNASPGNYKMLVDELDAFLVDYEASTQKIPPCKKAELYEAMACASSFLEENQRGERYWLQGYNQRTQQAPHWPQHKTIILELIASLFQCRAFSRYQKELRLKKLAEGEEAMNDQTHKMQKRSRPPSPAAHIVRLGSSDSEIGMEMSLKSMFHPELYSSPPKKFSVERCRRYLDALNPSRDTNGSTILTIEWLKTKALPWPPALDNKLHREMHLQDCYTFIHKNTAAIRFFLDMLTDTTKLADRYLTASEYRSLQGKVEKRMEYVLKNLQHNHYLAQDGTLRKTNGFREVWVCREDIWRESVHENSISPLNEHEAPRKKRTKPRAPKEPRKPQPMVDFPNLGRRFKVQSASNIAPELSPEQPDARANEASYFPKAVLANMAGFALSTMASEYHEDRRESEVSPATLCHSESFQMPQVGRSPERVIPPKDSCGDLDRLVRRQSILPDMPATRPLVLGQNNEGRRFPEPGVAEQCESHVKDQSPATELSTENKPRQSKLLILPIACTEVNPSSSDAVNDKDRATLNGNMSTATDHTQPAAGSGDDFDKQDSMPHRITITPVVGEPQGIIYQTPSSNTPSFGDPTLGQVPNDHYPSPPPSVSRVPTHLLRASISVEPQPSRLSTTCEPASNSTNENLECLKTPSRFPSPIHLLSPDRRPYAYTPDPTPFSTQRAIIFEPVPQPLPIKLSTDTRLATYKGPSEEPRQKVEFFLQKADKSTDFEDPQPSELMESSCALFFERYAHYSGVALSALEIVTFDCTWDDKPRFVIRRYQSEEAWKKLKKRLVVALELAKRQSPEETDFEVWVSIGDLNKLKKK